MAKTGQRASPQVSLVESPPLLGLIKAQRGASSWGLQGPLVVGEGDRQEGDLHVVLYLLLSAF